MCTLKAVFCCACTKYEHPMSKLSYWFIYTSLAGAGIFLQQSLDMGRLPCV